MVRHFIIATMVAGLMACSTQTVEDAEPLDAGVEGAAGAEAAKEAGSLAGMDEAAKSVGADTGQPKDDFTSFEDKPAAPADQQAAPAAGSPDQMIENELSQAGETPPPQGAPPAPGGKPGAAPPDEFAAFDAEPAQPQQPPVDIPPAVDAGQEKMAKAPGIQEPPIPAPEIPPAMPEVAPLPEAPAPALENKPALVHIKALQYRANDNGGTVVIEADGPLQFTTRSAAENNQFIIEIPNSKLPKKLKRSLNTKDFEGSYGAIDAYQKKGSTVTRIVLQLRPNVPEPTVQAEGNALLVVNSGAAPATAQAAPPPGAEGGGAAPPGAPPAASPSGAPAEGAAVSKLMTSENLEDFIANNQTFYGKKISIETDDVDIREIFKIISDEANVNLILSEEVRGKITVKLKSVPWDQALVLLMKTKKLGYSRTGNVIRISNLTDLRGEEKEAMALQTQRRLNATPKVRTVQVNYAKVEDLEKQVKGLLNKAGTVTSDPRTSSLIITDAEENIERAVKVIRSIDVPPQQVLIEGKVVEAKEDAEQNMGINWHATGAQTRVGGTDANPIFMTPNIGITPDSAGQRTFSFDLTLGTFDILGDLSASLGLFEKEGKAKILSAPRIVTMHNEAASIEQTIETPIRSSTASAGVVNNSVSFKEIKLLLEVTPQITNDGAVMMKLKVQREFLGEVADAQTGQKPNNRRVTQTRVLVRNGQTAVIGGVYQNDSSNGEGRVPWLGEIPVIGWLFKATTYSETKNELLVFVTPRILGQLDSQVIPSQTGGGGLEAPPTPAGLPAGSDTSLDFSAPPGGSGDLPPENGAPPAPPPPANDGELEL
ncbi:MAG: type IV pilus secretin PilQ [Bdellovibrio sp.]|nr:MAG: type IV pilus secretin PilQ [Bdellovibrio sp.]